jgi:hypothetical protein
VENDFTDSLERESHVKKANGSYRNGVKLILEREEKE